MIRALHDHGYETKALVSLNGWIRDEGESLIDLAQLNEGSLIPDSLRPVPYTNQDGSSGVDLYLLGTEDKAIPPATQRYMAERAKATIQEIGAAHASGA